MAEFECGFKIKNIGDKITGACVNEEGYDEEYTHCHKVGKNCNKKITISADVLARGIVNKNADAIQLQEYNVDLKKQGKPPLYKGAPTEEAYAKFRSIGKEVPKVKTPTPRVETPKVKTPTPKVETPKVKTPTPKVETPPKVKTPTPKVKTPRPKIETPEEDEIVQDDSDDSPLSLQSSDEDLSPIGSSKPTDEEELDLDSLDRDVKESCRNKNFFRNSHNSCYIDSLLFALLHVKNNGFIKSLRKIAKQTHKYECSQDVIDNLLVLYNIIHLGRDSGERISPSNIRNVIKNCIRSIIYKSIDKSKYAQKKDKPSLDELNSFFSDNKYKSNGKLKSGSANTYGIKDFSYYYENNSEKIFNYDQQDVNEIYSLLIILTNIPSQKIEQHKIYSKKNCNKSMSKRECNELKDPYLLSSTIYEDTNIIEGIYAENIEEANPAKMRTLTYNPKKTVDGYFYTEETSNFDESSFLNIYDNEDLPKAQRKLIGQYEVYQKRKIYKELDFLVINVNRYYTDYVNPQKIKLLYNYNFLETINTIKGELHLSSIVIHQGPNINSGHYVCLFKCVGTWYVMDDTDTSITILGDKPYTKTGEYTEQFVKQNCSMLFYF
jgi:hypothetical protein